MLEVVTLYNHDLDIIVEGMILNIGNQYDRLCFTISFENQFKIEILINGPNGSNCFIQITAEDQFTDENQNATLNLNLKNNLKKQIMYEIQNQCAIVYYWPIYSGDHFININSNGKPIDKLPFKVMIKQQSSELKDEQLIRFKNLRNKIIDIKINSKQEKSMFNEILYKFFALNNEFKNLPLDNEQVKIYTNKISQLLAKLSTEIDVFNECNKLNTTINNCLLDEEIEYSRQDNEDKKIISNKQLSDCSDSIIINLDSESTTLNEDHFSKASFFQLNQILDCEDHFFTIEKQCEQVNNESDLKKVNQNTIESSTNLTIDKKNTLLNVNVNNNNDSISNNNSNNNIISSNDSFYSSKNNDINNHSSNNNNNDNNNNYKQFKDETHFLDLSQHESKFLNKKNNLESIDQEHDCKMIKNNLNSNSDNLDEKHLFVKSCKRNSSSNLAKKLDSKNETVFRNKKNQKKRNRTSLDDLLGGLDPYRNSVEDLFQKLHTEINGGNPLRDSLLNAVVFGDLESNQTENLLEDDQLNETNIQLDTTQPQQSIKDDIENNDLIEEKISANLSNNDNQIFVDITIFEDKINNCEKNQFNFDLCEKTENNQENRKNQENQENQESDENQEQNENQESDGNQEQDENPENDENIIQINTPPVRNMVQHWTENSFKNNLNQNQNLDVPKVKNLIKNRTALFESLSKRQVLNSSITARNPCINSLKKKDSFQVKQQSTNHNTIRSELMSRTDLDDLANKNEQTAIKKNDEFIQLDIKQRKSFWESLCNQKEDKKPKVKRLIENDFKTCGYMKLNNKVNFFEQRV